MVCGALRKKGCEWARLYEHLLPRMCAYDEATRAYKGKKQVIGRIAGQIAAQVYALLKTDHELLSQLASGEEPPARLTMIQRFTCVIERENISHSNPRDISRSIGILREIAYSHS